MTPPRHFAVPVIAALPLLCGIAVGDSVVSTTPAQNLTGQTHNGLTNPIDHLATGGGRWGYGYPTEPTYDNIQNYLGDNLVVLADSSYGTPLKPNGGDYMGVVSLNLGQGWQGLRPAGTTGIATRYVYASGSEEWELGGVAHPSGLTTTISHLFFADKPVMRVWAQLRNTTPYTISVDVCYGGNLDSDGNFTQYVFDSDGDRVWETTDAWTITDDDGAANPNGNSGDPAWLHVWGEAGTPFPWSTVSASVNETWKHTGDGTYPATTGLNIAPGATVNLLFFEEMGNTSQELHDGAVKRYDSLLTLAARDMLSRIPDGTTFANWSRQAGATFDFGDAPDSLATPAYPTLLDNDGAHHVLTGLRLGTTADQDRDGQPTTAADGDDGDGTDDEDGVTFGVLSRGDAAANIGVLVAGAQTGTKLDAWIDFNRDGDWLDAGEQVFANQNVADGSNALTASIPQTATLGNTYARFRLSNAGGLAPTGMAQDGEVEDYQVAIVDRCDLEITKMVDKPTPSETETIVYTLTVTNYGPSQATTVRVADPLPTGVTYVSSTASQGSYASATGAWAIGTMDKDAAVTLTITATVDNGAAALTQPIANSAAVSSDQDDPNTTNNNAVANFTAQGLDLSVDKQVDNSTPTEGQAVQYTVTVTNNGAVTATGVAVTDQLPTGVTFGSATATLGTYVDTSGVWTLGSLASGTTATLTLNATVKNRTAGQTITNTATLSAHDQTDPTSSNDSKSADIVPVGIDLSLTKVVDDTTPDETDTIVYTLSLTNNGAAAATNVTVNDVLPTGVTYVSSTPGAGTYSNGTGDWTLTSIAAGATETLEITATVDNGAAALTQPITNMAMITAQDQTDPNTGNNDGSAAVTVRGLDLAVDKQVNDSTPTENDTVQYTVEVTNNGAATATGVEVTDQLPTGVTFDSAAATQGAYAVANGLWTVGDLTPAATATLTLIATVDNRTAGQTITNTATISAHDQTDPTSNNDSKSVDLVPGGIDLSLDKQVDNPTPNETDTIEYDLTVGNPANVAATGVEVTDQLPAGVTYKSASLTQGTYNAATGIWDVGTLPSGNAATLTIAATVDNGAAALTQPIPNTATITAHDQTDPTSSNDSSSADINVKGLDLSLDKQVSKANPTESDTVTYTVTVVNNGDATATAVKVTDQLPAGVSFVSATPTPGTYDNATGLWTIGDLASGATATLTLAAKVNNGTAGQTITNAASLNTPQQTDPNPNNNSKSVDIVPVGINLSVTKTVDQTNPAEHADVRYTMTVDNPADVAATGVVVTDQLPQGVTYLTHNAPAGTTYDQSTGLWNVGALASGTTLTLTIDARPNNGTAGQQVLNEAQLTAHDQTDPNSSNDRASAGLTPQGIDLGLTKTVSDSQPTESATIQYDLQVENLGPAGDATGVAVTDTLPPGLTYVSDNVGGTYDAAARLWRVDLGTVPVGASVTAALTVLVDNLAAGQWQPIKNAASVSGDQTDPVSTNDSAQAPITVAGIDLVVEKSVDDDTPPEGATVQYTVKVTNEGALDATGVVAEDVLPQGVTYAGNHSASHGTYDPQTGRWNIGTLSNAAPAVLTVDAKINDGAAGRRITNEARLTAHDQTDPDGANDQASAGLTPQGIDLDLTKTVSETEPTEGATIQYTIHVENVASAGAATGVVVTDTLPAGVTYISDDVRATHDSANRRWTWTVGNLAQGAKRTAVITVKVDNGAAELQQPLVNTASVSGDQTDPVSTNDRNDASITVEGLDLEIEKLVSEQAPIEGDTVTYELKVTNHGAEKATGVEVTDLLPQQVSYVSHAPAAAAYDKDTGLWRVGEVAPGATVTLTINATVNLGTMGQTVSNTAEITAHDQTDPNSQNDRATATLTPEGLDLNLGKTVDNSSPTEQDTVVFTVTVTNHGARDVTGIEVTDALAAGLVYQSSQSFRANGGSAGTYDAASGVWTLGALAPNESVRLELTATVDAGAGGSAIANRAEITHADQSDPDTSDNADEVQLVVQSADLGITKTAQPEPATAGQELTYAVVVTNHGPHAATAVRAVDTLPARGQFVSATSTQGSADYREDPSGARTVTCDIGDLAVGASVTITIKVKPTIVGTLTNRAEVSGHEADQVAANDTVALDTQVVSGEASALSLSTPSTQVRAGAAAELTILVSDDQGNGVPLTEVSATVEQGQGSLVFAADPPVTDAHGEVRATLQHVSFGANTVKAQVVGSRATADPIEDTLSVLGVFELQLRQGLQILTIPFKNLPNADAAHLLGITPEHLRLAGYDPAANGGRGAYTLYTAQQPFDLLLGRGYFGAFETPRMVTIAEGSFEPTRADPPLDIAFAHRGWQLFGNPFLTALEWDADSIELVHQGQSLGLMKNFLSGSASLNRPMEVYGWAYRPSSPADPDPYTLVFDGDYAGHIPAALQGFATQLQVGEGVFVLANQDTAGYRFGGEFAQGDRTGGRAASTDSLRRASDTDWSFEVVAQCGDARDGTNVLGVMSGQAGGFQLAEPPIIDRSGGTYLSFAFAAQPGKSRLRSGNGEPALLAADVRPEIGTTAQWDAVLRTNRADTPVTLSWPDLSTLPRRYRAYLVDAETGERRAMRTTTSYQFRSNANGATERRFRIEVDAAATSRLTISNLVIAPNGRGPGMSVGFTLSQPARVQLMLQSSAGRALQTSPPQQAEAGPNAVQLTGRSATGQPLPRGMYLLQLVAEADTGERVRAVRPLAVR